MGEGAFIWKSDVTHWGCQTLWLWFDRLLAYKSSRKSWTRRPLRKKLHCKMVLFLTVDWWNNLFKRSSTQVDISQYTFQTFLLLTSTSFSAQASHAPDPLYSSPLWRNDTSNPLRNWKKKRDKRGTILCKKSMFKRAGCGANVWEMRLQAGTSAMWKRSADWSGRGRLQSPSQNKHWKRSWKDFGFW